MDSTILSGLALASSVASPSQWAITFLSLLTFTGPWGRYQKPGTCWATDHLRVEMLSILRRRLGKLGVSLAAGDTSPTN